MTLEQHGALGRFKAGDPCYLRCRVVGHDSKVDTKGIPRVALEIIGKDGKPLTEDWYYVDEAWLIDGRVVVQELKGEQ